VQYLQVLRKLKYFCNVAITPIKQICNRIPGFVQNGIVTSCCTSCFIKLYVWLWWSSAKTGRMYFW